MYIVGSGILSLPRHKTPISDLVDAHINLFESRTGINVTRLELDTATYAALLSETSNSMYKQYTPQNLYENGVTYKGIPVTVKYIDYVHIVAAGSSEGIKTEKLESMW